MHCLKRYFHLFLIVFMSVSARIASFWTSSNAHIIFNNTVPFHVRGLNWFGYETDCKIVHGLWVNSLDTYFDMLANDIQINALRIPFSYECIEQWNEFPKSDCVTANPWLSNITIKDTLHVLFQKAAQHNIVILLDFHTVHGKINDVLLPEETNLSDFLSMWRKVLQEFSSYPNLLGIDIKNEPHGSISWTEWSQYFTTVISFICSDIPQYKGLFFIEGVEDRFHKSVWGGSFTDLQPSMIHFVPKQRIVFSPHVYGNSVRGDIANQDTDDLFNLWFGDLTERFPNETIVIGEIGGMNVGGDFLWQEKIFSYLEKKNIRNGFYWCLNPNSYDTGGVLEYDWRTLDWSKIKLQWDVQPNATFLSFI